MPITIINFKTRAANSAYVGQTEYEVVNTFGHGNGSIGSGRAGGGWGTKSAIDEDASACRDLSTVAPMSRNELIFSCDFESGQ